MRFLSLFLILALATAAKTDEKDVVKKVNANNSTIQSYVSDLDIVLHKRALTITSVGKNYYEKPRNYRLQTTNVRTNQMGSDIGSNSDVFWFWIKRLDPTNLHFSQYKNLMSTNLPDSLHPVWMMDTLGINQIETENSTIYTQEELIVVQENKTSTRRQEITKVTLIDSKRPAIVGFKLYTKSGKVFASCDIKSFFKTNSGIYLPQQSVTRWQAEQIVIDTTVRNPRVNVKIDPKTFQMPQYKNLRTIDISKQKVNFQEGRL